MKLVGSRSRKDFDKFSDWDFQIETIEDFNEVFKQLSQGVISKVFTRTDVFGITIINPDGQLLDFSSQASFEKEWNNLKSIETDSKIREYWVITFKHLKALYREYEVLSEVGIEITTAIARDIYFEEKLKAPRYKDFFEFRKIKDKISKQEEGLSNITGMPYITREQKIQKIIALNSLVAMLAPKVGVLIQETFNKSLKLLS